MRKYCEFYFTIKKTEKGFTYTIREVNGKVIQTALETSDGDEDEAFFVSKEMAEQGAREAIQDYYT
jgi:hypothetical protein